jgi:hypothetical protein
MKKERNFEGVFGKQRRSDNNKIFSRLGIKQEDELGEFCVL